MPSQFNLDSGSNGGVAEFQDFGIVGLGASAGASVPNLVLYLDTTDMSVPVTLNFDVQDLDGSSNDAQQQLNVQYRIGDSGDVVLRIETGYPLDGAIRVTVVSGPRTPWTLSLRVPAWAHGAVLAAGGEQRDAEPGYATVTRAFEPGEVVELHLPVVARWTWPDARVDAVRGQVAVERGPLVLCLESTDLGASVNTAVVRTDVPPLEDGGAVKVAVSTLDVGDAGWPYGEHGAPDGPGTVRGTVDRGLVSLIPYQQWANRGPSTMRVWMPTLD